MFLIRNKEFRRVLKKQKIVMFLKRNKKLYVMFLQRNKTFYVMFLKRNKKT